MRSTIFSSPSLAAFSEAELIQRAKAREETAIRAILEANNRRLFRIARGILRNDSEAEDVVQETYVRALRQTALAPFQGAATSSTVISSITRVMKTSRKGSGNWSIACSTASWI